MQWSLPSFSCPRSLPVGSVSCTLSVQWPPGTRCDIDNRCLGRTNHSCAAGLCSTHKGSTICTKFWFPSGSEKPSKLKSESPSPDTSLLVLGSSWTPADWSSLWGRGRVVVTAHPLTSLPSHWTTPTLTSRPSSGGDQSLLHVKPLKSEPLLSWKLGVLSTIPSKGPWTGRPVPSTQSKGTLSWESIIWSLTDLNYSTLPWFISYETGKYVANKNLSPVPSNPSNIIPGSCMASPGAASAWIFCLTHSHYLLKVIIKNSVVHSFLHVQPFQTVWGLCNYKCFSSSTTPNYGC